jgi:hypothetical protein
VTVATDRRCRVPFPHAPVNAAAPVFLTRMPTARREPFLIEEKNVHGTED